MSAVRGAVAWASLGKFLSFSIAFSASIIIARWYLGPAEVGLFSIAFAATALLAVLQEFGLNRYIVGEEELGPEKIRVAYSVSVVIAWGIALLVLIAAKPVALLYGDERLFPLMLVIGASYLFVPLAIVPTALLHRAMDFRSDFLIEVGASLANAAVSLTLAAHGWSAMALAWGAFAQQVTRATISQWRNGGLLPWPLRFDGAGPVLRFGGGSTMLQIFDSLGSRAPDLIVGGIAGNYAVGLYSRGSGLAVQLIYLMTGAVNSVFYPALARLRNEGHALAQPYLRMVAGYSGIVWPAMAGLALSAYPLVSTLYGPRWVEVAPILSLLAVAQMAFVAIPMAVQVPILLGRMDGVLVRSGLAVVTLLVLLAIGAQWGARTAAMAYVVYGVLSTLLYAPFLHRLIGFSWSGLFAIYARSLAGALAACLPLALAYHYWREPAAIGLLPLLVLVGAGVGFWLVTLSIVRHPVLNDLRAILTGVTPAFIKNRLSATKSS